nr:MAG TPA: hypothetical protein [Caudoviricetes sp.]
MYSFFIFSLYLFCYYGTTKGRGLVCLVLFV